MDRGHAVGVAVTDLQSIDFGNFQKGFGNAGRHIRRRGIGIRHTADAHAGINDNGYFRRGHTGLRVSQCPGQIPGKGLVAVGIDNAAENINTGFRRFDAFSECLR